MVFRDLFEDSSRNIRRMTDVREKMALNRRVMEKMSQSSPASSSTRCSRGAQGIEEQWMQASRQRSLSKRLLYSDYEQLYNSQSLIRSQNITNG